MKAFANAIPIVLVASVLGAQSQRPMTFLDAQNMRQVSGQDVSPNGRMMLYVLSTPGRWRSARGPCGSAAARRCSAWTRGPGACARRFRDSLCADRGVGDSVGDANVVRGRNRGARPPVAVPTLNATAAVTSAVEANTTFMAERPPSGDPYIVVPSGRGRHPERLLSLGPSPSLRACPVPR